LILDCHRHCQHAGRTKTFNLVQQRFYGISRQEVSWVLKNCDTCIKSEASKSQAPLEPIKCNYILERVQIDLIDMRARPYNGYHWILHIKDHFSKYSFLYPLSDKTATGVARCIAYWLGIVDIPKILQCDNSKEFKGVLLVLLKKYGVKIINRRPRYLQTQGLVEQANGVVKKNYVHSLQSTKTRGGVMLY